MKSFKFFAVAAICACSIFGFTSCNSDDGPSIELYQIDLEKAQIEFNPDNYWADCYNAAAGDIKVGNFSFSHKAWADEWDGVSYPAWKGFCPSKVNDNAEHADDWVAHQWACLPGNPNDIVYLVGNSEAVVSENPLANDKCSLSVNEGYFIPQYAFVANSTYAYYAAKNGTAFNSKFTATDNFVLNVVGVRNGVMTKQLKYPLMAGGQFLLDWAYISLAELGTVDKVLFYIDSTQKNAYGLTVPSYFCLTSFVYSLPSDEAK